MNTMSILWLIAAGVFILIEAVTYQLVSIWFVAGCIASAAVVAIKPDIPMVEQLAICLSVSAVIIIITRPLVKKLVDTKKEATNVDAIIGKTAVVTQEISNVEARGEAQVDGKMWTARNAGEGIIEKDSVVRVVKIDGVKLIVSKEEQE